MSVDLVQLAQVSEARVAKTNVKFILTNYAFSYWLLAVGQAEVMFEKSFWLR